MTRTDKNADATKIPSDKAPDQQYLSENLARALEKNRRMVLDWLKNNESHDGANSPEQNSFAHAIAELTTRLWSDPARLFETQMEMYQDYLNLWQQSMQKMMGEETKPVITPEKGDRRFKDSQWSENQLFDFIKQSYLLTAHHMQKAVRETKGLDQEDARKADFLTRQFIDAVSPSNFVLTNPQVLKATLDSGGENLVKGMQNLLRDLEKGGEMPAISMTDDSAFELGRTIATTPGKVVYENDLFQLIQYSPTTDSVHEVPLLIIPPWINKFYILDLTPEKSFVTWCVDQGLTVFMVSWVNPDATLRNKTLDDYMKDGQLRALDVVEEIIGIRGVNVIGYCIAGTLFAATLAWLHAKGEEDRVKSTTFFTAQLDFEDAGELKVFVDDEQLKALSKRMHDQGYLDARAMFTTFNLLRANDLIWSFVVNNYLLGKDPLPFDLLYWNADSTNIAAAVHEQYLRAMYYENALAKPNGLILDGTPIDLGRIKTPLYIQAGREDHIAPAQSVYKLTGLVSGPKRFVLAGSGHIAGVVNPPAAKKYQYWTKSGRLPKSLDRFIEGAKETPGSWWPDWLKWQQKHAGPMIPARASGSKGHPPIEDAPGRYVKVRAK